MARQTKQQAKDNKKSNIGKEEILANLEIQARKLIFLLANSKLPQEVKEAWVALLPEMNLAQMDRLRNILEARFLDIQTSEIDEIYQKKLEKIKKKIQKEQEENNQTSLEQLKVLKEVIKK